MNEKRFETDKELRELVYNTLMKVLKKMKMYHIFKMFIGYDDYNAHLPNDICCIILFSLDVSQYDTPLYKIMCNANRRRDENPFFHSTTKYDIISRLGDIGNPIQDGEDNVKIKQRRITELINTLIHCCIEKGVKDYSILEKMGQEIFNLVCEEVFGKGFKDETEDDIPQELKDKIKNMSEELGCKNIHLNQEFMETIRRIIDSRNDVYASLDGISNDGGDDYNEYTVDDEIPF